MRDCREKPGHRGSHSGLSGLCRRLAEARILLLFAVLIILSFPSSSFASGLAQGARMSGMGAAFAAVADDASAVAANPAGMTQLKGTHLYGGLSLLVPSTTFGGAQGGEEKTRTRYFFPPHLYVVTDFGASDLRFGLGIFSPYGIGGRIWQDGGATRYLATKNEILTLTLNPSVAYRISPSVSAGLGFNVIYSEYKQRYMVSQRPLGGDATVDQKGSGFGTNFNAGLMVTPSPQWRLAAVYRALLKVTHRGSARVSGIAPLLQPVFGGPAFSTDMRTSVTLPDVLTAGIAYSPVRRLTLSVEVERAFWSRMDSLATDLEQEVPLAGVTDQVKITGNRDTWNAKAGFEYELTDRLSLRGGYGFWASPVPSDVLDPGNPDADQHTLSGGIGYELGNLVIDGYYMLGIYSRRTSSNPSLPGTYRGTTHYAGISAGYSF